MSHGDVSGTFIFILYILKVSKDGQMLCPLGLHSSGQPPPTSRAPPTCPPGYCPALHHLQQQAAGQSKEVPGDPCRPLVRWSLQGPLPSCVGTPAGEAGVLGHFQPCQAPLSPSDLVLVSAQREAQVRGSGVQHQLLGFSHVFFCLCLQPPSFPAEGGGVLSFPILGESQRRSEEGGQEEVSLLDWGVRSVSPSPGPTRPL